LMATRHNLPDFLRTELNDRLELHYPPFSRVLLIHIQSPEETKAHNFSHEISKLLQNDANLTVVGPMVAPIAKIKQLYRYQLWVQAKTHKPLYISAKSTHEFLKKNKKKLKNLTLKFDMDPVHLH